MKSMRAMIMCMALAIFYVGGMTACSKGGGSSSNQLSYGSANSDGSNLYSSTTIQGFPLNLTINNITAYGANSGYNNGYYNNSSYYGQSTSGTVSFAISVNGATSYVQGQVAWANWQTLGNFYVSYSGACADYSCTTAVATVLVAPLTSPIYEYRQFAIKKNLISGQVSAVREYTINNPNSVPNAQVLMYQF